MSSSGGLTGTPLKSGFGFNWVFLIELLVCGILTLFFLFYFNRLFATLISYGFRAWTWHKYRVYIDIQALQFSLLGGRIFFKGFRYHGNNETILIHSGYITWCYWLRNVRDLNVGRDPDVVKSRIYVDFNKNEKNVSSHNIEGAEQNVSNKQADLPCRLSLSLNGAEWFVYNRSAAYDAIVAGMTGQESNPRAKAMDQNQRSDGSDAKFGSRRKRSDPEQDDSALRNSADRHQAVSQMDETSFSDPKSQDSASQSSQTETFGGRERSNDHGSPEGAFILRFLPISVECARAAVVLGNENTKSVLITKVDKATGLIDATKSKTLDQYKQLFKFQFEHPVIQMKPNDDYKEDQTAAAIRIKHGEAKQTEQKDHHVHSHSFLHRQRRKVWHKLQDLVPAFRSSVDSISSSETAPQASPQPGNGSYNWQGLSRYLEESEQDDKARWSSIEYATVTTIVDSPKANMSFYWDVVGTVPERAIHPDTRRDKHVDRVNGDPPPEWGLDLFLKGGTISYGPWADRQRADIQRVFFPNLCKDAIPATPLVPGQFRVPTEFKLYMEFEDETILRVPTREESKNWKWTKHVDSMGMRENGQKNRGNKSRKSKADKSNPGPEIRPFGWFDVKVGANATVVYSMDMLAGPSGFSNNLQLDLPNLEITTSVNHGLLWRSVDNQLSCDLSNPLQWNGHHTWQFDIRNNGLELFILREHVFLLIDLVDDWASGPPPDYFIFTPFNYLINLHFEDFRLYLNVNDGNIVNNPSDFDDNTYIIIYGSILDAKQSIPIESYRPHRNNIPFDVQVKDGGLRLHVPPWNTQATFMDSTCLATLNELKVTGKYQYCATTSTANTDTLLLAIHGHGPVARLYGFVIRYFLKIKDNYFGDDIRFKTLEEYQDVLRSKREGNEDESNVQPHKKSNDLDVILGVTAVESSVILPSNLYSAKEHTRIDIASLAADLRFTNYYMDLDVALSTLAFSLGNEQDGATTPLSAISGTQLFIDGISATGNRLFGLPPTEPTYLCNWDFSVGAVTGESTVDFFRSLVKGARAFVFSFDDDENALPSVSAEVLHDITFLRATVESVRFWLHVDEAAFLFSMGSISVSFNDWASSHYSKKLKVLIPELSLGCVDAESASRHRSRAQQPVETHALLQTTLSFAMIQRKPGFEEDRDLQQQHVKRHDQRTHRTHFLLYPSLLDDSMLVPVDQPAMKVPPMPQPMPCGITTNVETHSLATTQSSVRLQNKAVAHKSSFLSMSNSSQKSKSRSVQNYIYRRENDFPSDSRSRSLQATAGADRRIPLRDISVSTGRPSSFYSAVGDHGKGMPSSSVAFSSSYIAPYFPLEGVEPDAKDLPDILQDTREHYSAKSLEDIAYDRADKDSTHISFMLEMPCGIAAVCNPRAMIAVADLVTALQAVEPDDILDKIQIDSMTQVFDINKQKSITGKVVDLSLRAPCISLRFIDYPDPGGPHISRRTVHDQYDLMVAQLSFTLRSQTLAKESISHQGLRKSSAAHLSFASANISANERHPNVSQPQAAINGNLEDVACWLKFDDKRSVAIAFKRVEAATSSNKIEYLASLLHRTDIIANEIIETFSSVINKQHDRVQLFTYLTATTGQRAPDPLFLTRPSYALRSATDHLRTTDSWKVVARLRHMYTTLHTNLKEDITTRCLSLSESLPVDARQSIIASFNQWRSWDLNDIHTSLVMQAIFGPLGRVKSQLELSQPTKVEFRTELIRLVLDPGPKQNEIAFVNFTSNFESSITPLKAEDKSLNDEMPIAQTSILQTFCADVAINLNWELCELAEDILKLYSQTARRAQSKKVPAPSITSKNCQSSLSPRHNVHVIVATEKGNIIIDTINIRAASICENMKASLIMIDPSASETGKSASLVVSADAATSKIRHRSQDLSVYQIRFPSLYGSYELSSVYERPIKTIHIAGNCQQLNFATKQDILALVEVLDLVIGDEVTQLYRLKKYLSHKPAPMVPSIGLRQKVPSIVKVNVALFLDMYDIGIPLLHSLTYKITGVVARASLVAVSKSEVIFDFDIKEHAHDIQTVAANKTRSISLLQMPPTNGHLTCSLSEKETTLSIFASVEPIGLDASAIHSLLTALNRPEISSVVSDIQEEVHSVQNHIEELFGPSKKSMKKDQGSKSFIYDAHLTLAGFNIFANASGAHSNSKSARLDFNLGCIQLVFANRLEQNGPELAFPELRIGIHHIMFELSRFYNGSMEPCGNLTFAAFLTASSRLNETGDEIRSFHLESDALEISLFAETASSVVDIMANLQDKIKDVDLSREKKYLRKLRNSKPRLTVNDDQQDAKSNTGSIAIFSSMYSLELLSIQVCWIVGPHGIDHASRLEREDLILSLKRIALSTRKENTAKLTIEDLQLQMVPPTQNKIERSLNSALLPEIVFNVGYVSSVDARRFAFQAAGKSLDLRLTSLFIIPAAAIQKSIASAVEKVRVATENWSILVPAEPTENTRRQPFFGTKRMESLLVDADFAGAVVYLSSKKNIETMKANPAEKINRTSKTGRYGQFSQNDASNTVLRAPGLAWKIEYKDNGLDEPSLNAEVKVDASNNILFPTVVPLILEISSTVKEIVSDEDDNKKKHLQTKASPQKFMSADEDNILTADPSTVLGRTKLNLGIRICQQEFSLSCQPIARVAATARFDDIYITVNTVRSDEHGHFFAISSSIRKLGASVQHVYSRESTGSFEIDSVFLSFMNSKHVSGTSGVSAILNISPMKVLVNAKQLQDFLLFREIWVPPEIRQSSMTSAPTSSTAQSQTLLVHRYQQVAATGAFPWNATISIAELDVQLDLGQAIGKSAFVISKFWISSKKNSDWEQNLCLGFEKVGVDSTGRMSGFVALQDFKLRTSIQWPAREMALNQTPLIQGSLGFSQLRVKAAFDYQAFLVADITKFDFIMYNVRSGQQAKGDRLVAILDGDAVQVFGTTSTAAQTIALFQAFERLVQEKKANYESSLAEIEKFMQRKSSIQPPASPMPKAQLQTQDEEKVLKSPISLHTDVIVTLKAVNVGAFPNTFSDHQIFKLEALNAQARFAVIMEAGKIHSSLGLTLGQLRIGLAGVKNVEGPKSVNEISVEDVVSSATGSRGGTILKVPKVEASMQTWQVPDTNHIDYIFKSFFEGKVEVGWNYSRISYIRSMWATHSKALAQRLGKPLPSSAIKITGVPDEERKDGEQQKITAEVNVPQSKYDYTALEPPIIETPQLRDMGEATPPLEWIGLHRDRLPNLMHQIVIVTLLELASEVEDAYEKILGSS